MLITIIAVVGNVCNPTATTAVIISAHADCRYLHKTDFPQRTRINGGLPRSSISAPPQVVTAALPRWWRTTAKAVARHSRPIVFLLRWLWVAKATLKVWKIAFWEQAPLSNFTATIASNFIMNILGDMVMLCKKIESILCQTQILSFCYNSLLTTRLVLQSIHLRRRQMALPNCLEVRGLRLWLLVRPARRSA